ncbi:MAG: sugar kinase [Ruminococcaceae bacterium]|nr:sugar kinase [Oscillospiraceae bacterium]
MGVRITPANRQPVHVSTDFTMQATSAESNVLNISASLGLRTKVLTAFVAESPIALFIKGDLRRRNIEYEGRDVPQGGPWGYRHQFNIADSGFGTRGPRVHNDRAGEVGRTISAADFDLEKLFAKDGVKILHLSGLFAALSPETATFCRELARIAHANGTVISFDLNYRASFWKDREAELTETFAEIAGLADILIGNEEDFQLALKVPGPESGGKDVGKTESFKAMILNVKKQYPGASVFATTLRQVLSANAHMWGAIMLDGEEWFNVEPREIGVLDRIGGGDGFVGGMLYGILRGWESEKCIQFGWASGALVTTLLTDYGEPADEDVIWSIYSGNARVKR